MDKIGVNIKRLRNQRGITQAELGEKINVSDKAISRWESGSGLPEISNLIALAKVFGITVDELLTESLAVSDHVQPIPQTNSEIVTDKTSDGAIKKAFCSPFNFINMLFVFMLPLGISALAFLQKSRIEQTIQIIFLIILIAAVIVWELIFRFKAVKNEMIFYGTGAALYFLTFILVMILAILAIFDNGSYLVALIALGGFLLVYGIRYIFAAVEKAAKRAFIVFNVVQIIVSGAVFLLSVFAFLFCVVINGMQIDALQIGSLLAAFLFLSETIVASVKKRILLIIPILAAAAISGVMCISGYMFDHSAPNSIFEINSLFYPLIYCFAPTAYIIEAVSGFVGNSTVSIILKRIAAGAYTHFLIIAFIPAVDSFAVNIFMGHTTWAVCVFLRMTVFAAILAYSFYLAQITGKRRMNNEKE